MWYLIAGKFMTLLIYFIFSKASLFINDLNLLDRLIGWFFVEHLFEEHNLHSGKFFLTNLNFRVLIKNSFIILRNVFIWSHFITLMEFVVIIPILFLITYFLSYFFKLKRIKFRIIEVFIFVYYCFIIHLLILKTFLSFDLFDIYFIFKPIIIILFTISSSSIAVRFYSLLLFLFVSNARVQPFLVIFIKIICYSLIFLFLISLFLGFLLITFESTYNMIQECFIKLLIVYTYTYYLKKYKCQQLISFVEKNGQ